MAPEFFPFLEFIVLAAGVLLAAILGVGLRVWARRDARLSSFLRRLSTLAFCGALFMGLLLFFLGRGIRQQYFLNEPLVTACGNGQLTEAQRLLARGASPNAYGIDFVETGLIAAARAGDRDIVLLLLRNGADAGLRDHAGKTAVERAREKKHHEIAALIEEFGQPQ